MSLRLSAICLAVCLFSTAALAVPPSGNVSQRDLIGRWGQNGNCRDWISYNADGTWERGDGDGGEWALDHNMLSVGMNGAGGASSATVRKLPDGSIARTASFDGHTDHLTRCAVPPVRRPAPRRR